jgi:hypothetical protein
METPANNACTRRLGVCAFSDTCLGLESIPSNWRPPQAPNANRWAAQPTSLLRCGVVLIAHNFILTKQLINGSPL